MHELFNIALMFAVALLSLGLIIVTLRWLEHLAFPGLSFEDELRKGNMAVAIVVTAIIVILGLMVRSALAGPLPASSHRYDAQFHKWCHFEFGYTYDCRYFKAQGLTESRLDPRVCSGVGACGVMQLMPGTALAMGVQDRFDAKESIRAGIRYDRQLWAQWAAPRPPLDRLAFALAAYNAGLGSVLSFQREARRGGRGDPNLWGTVAPFAWHEPRDYVTRIIDGWFPRLAPLEG